MDQGADLTNSPLIVGRYRTLADALVFTQKYFDRRFGLIR